MNIVASVVCLFMLSRVRGFVPFLIKSNPNPNSSTPSTTARHMNYILDMLGAGKLKLIDPQAALPGRPEPMQGIDGLEHYVLKNPIPPVPPGYKEAVFANGCFWGTEKSFWRLPKGIYSTAVGYCAGFTPNPTYEEVCTGLTGHTEGCRVVYDESQISFVDLLRMFWESHDPTSGMGQGNDRGTQYRSGFYPFDTEQEQLINASLKAYEDALEKRMTPRREITTEVRSAQYYQETFGKLWYFAEPYHQQYLAKPGSRPYCSAQPTGVSLPPYDTWCPFDEGSALKEKHRPKLPESFWAQHGPKKGCSVVTQTNSPIKMEEL